MSYLSRLGLRTPNYDKSPTVRVPELWENDLCSGWTSLSIRVSQELGAGTTAVGAIDCYPGVHVEELGNGLRQRIQNSVTILTATAFKPEAEIEALVAPFLGGDDPVFGHLNHTLTLADFLDLQKLDEVKQRIISEASKGKVVLVIGAGAHLFVPEGAVMIYADMPRWEGQLRQRRGLVDNLGVQNRGTRPSLQYKRSYFVDWRVADRHKRATMEHWDFVLDTTSTTAPKMISAAAHAAGLKSAASRPFRVVPFFDPGPWGGQWMRDVCQLKEGPPNYAWCFDCVPEENSLLLEFAGGTTFEIPSQNIVYTYPRELLGEPVFGRFGAEFPIRFDFLDTMGGGNLSFQVHPTEDYARQHFGLPYTQDESYYILDAEPGAIVYLGCKDKTKPGEMIGALQAANDGGAPFDAARFAGSFPARKHDHFLIPAGTLHCSGANSMVLEISATPYIFTFKLWDWSRLGLDGKPRPLNVKRGADVICWDRDETYARKQLVNHFEPIASGPGWREERTGLHPSEFIETRRHWFTGPVTHETGGPDVGGVNVLNLIEGDEVIVESPSGAFAPFTVHYAETFIVPAAVGLYIIRPTSASPGREFATLKAFVRPRP